MTDRAKTIWVLAITGVALFMVNLDSLVVTTALPVIKRDLRASLSGLEWTVNAYTLAFAVLLLTGTALGDRFGRRRLFVVGVAVFTAGSAAAALAPGIGGLVAARAVQGVGAAVVMPLTLTIVSAAVAPGRRGLAIGAWGGVSGLAVAIGPLVGGAVVEGMSWHWIFWLNVPIGVVVVPLALIRLSESTGPDRSVDLLGLGLASVGLLGLVLGLVRGNEYGWRSVGVAGPLAMGAALLVLFIAWQFRSATPMIPMRFFRSREFSAANATSLLMFFGLFGSIFLLAQFLQLIRGYSPLEAGLRTLPWTGMLALVTPIAGALSDRIGSRSLVVSGMALLTGALAWMASIVMPTVAYGDLVVPFVVAGVGMSLFFAPTANAILSAVGRDEEGKASGVLNTIRQVGGVFGVAVLATVFSAAGGYESPSAFVEGLASAMWVGAGVVGLGTVAALGMTGPKAVVLTEVLVAPGVVPPFRKLRPAPAGRQSPLAAEPTRTGGPRPHGTNGPEPS